MLERKEGNYGAQGGKRATPHGKICFAISAWRERLSNCPMLMKQTFLLLNSVKINTHNHPNTLRLSLTNRTFWGTPLRFLKRIA